MRLYCAVRTVAIWITLGLLAVLVYLSITYKWSDWGVIWGMVVLDLIVLALDRFVVRPVPDPRQDNLRWGGDRW